MIRSKWRRSFQSRGVSGFLLLSRVEVGGKCLENRAFGVDVFVEGGAWYVYKCVLVVLIECVSVVFVPPGEVGWNKCGG